MPNIRVNGVELHYLEHGEGPLPVVFGHGTMISAKVWRDHYFPSLPASWRALALDFRGHGGSHAAAHGCTFMQMADDVAAMADQLGLGRFVYVGVSMGGGVGLQLALRRPDLLLGLVLISTVTGLGPLGGTFARFFGGLSAGRRWLLRAVLRSAAVRRPEPAMLERVVEEAMLVKSSTLCEYLSRDNRIVGIEGLSSLEVPTLVVIGERDRVIPVSQQTALAEAIPGCRRVVYPDEGHTLVAEIPERVLGEIRAFVDGLQI